LLTQPHDRGMLIPHLWHWHCYKRLIPIPIPIPPTSFDS